MEQNNPTLDYEALASLDGEARAAAIAEYTAAIEERASLAAKEKYDGELRAVQYANAKYRLASGLKDFSGRIEAIEEIARENPALMALDDEERLRTAYYIDRGMRADESPSAEELLMRLRENPEAMRLCEAAILAKLKTEASPAFAAAGSVASVPLTPQKKPKSIDEASSLARAAFGI
ncbi:MAG: hypothetical protein IKU61_00870 [Clostridia bacterium]|nr:hypothetical protein [Clostridia bacterium]